ncbi:MAG: UTP--glucose-1-phosphate uridylyltransferase GalU [Alphaproteobacteria bacterium]
MTSPDLKRPVRKAVFPVAGLGTRFLPATKAMPKEMLTINDRPLIQHVYEEAREAGIEQFIFITGRGKEMLEEHFDYQHELEETLRARGKDDFLKAVQDSNIPASQLFCTRQPEPLGLGHAIWCASKIIGDEPFAVILPDVLAKGCLKQMMDIYNETGGNIIALEEVPKEDTHKYGIADIQNDDGRKMEIKHLVEKPKPEDAPSNLHVLGRYILQADVFDHLSEFEKGAGGEIQLTDAMAKLIGQQPFYGMRYQGKSYDSGSRLGFIEANLAYGLGDRMIGDDVRKLILKYAGTINGEDLKNAAAE